MSSLSILPAAAVADERLTDAQVRVLCAIGTYTNKLGGNVWASVQTLAKSCNLNPRTVQRALPVLLEHGYLRVQERPGRTNLYGIVLDRPLTPESPRGDTGVVGGVTPVSPKRYTENDKTNVAQEITKAVWRVYPQRDTPHLFPPALRAITALLKDGAVPERLVRAAEAYALECAKKRTEPRYVRTISRFFSDGAWEQYGTEVRVHGRTREEWARSGQDVLEFDRMAGAA
jgi:DNA-binding transcriptional ArsR family regulator